MKKEEIIATFINLNVLDYRIQDDWKTFMTAYTRLLQLFELQNITDVSVKFPFSFKKCQKALLRGNLFSASEYLAEAITWYKLNK